MRRVVIACRLSHVTSVGVGRQRATLTGHAHGMEAVAIRLPLLPPEQAACQEAEHHGVGRQDQQRHGWGELALH